MRSNVFLSLFFVVLFALSPLSSAQEGTVPGIQVRNLLITELEKGTDIQDASNQVSEKVIDEALYFDASGTAYLAENQKVFESLVGLLNDNASGFELAIAGFAQLPIKHLKSLLLLF